ncbi:MAG: photosynthetic protein synthase I [Betaproteobacteria bacterium SG8_40]|nr:MAG: photosynthetic protein synthase I [Betaproteobacteria bacterium SG8_40]
MPGPLVTSLWRVLALLVLSGALWLAGCDEGGSSVAFNSTDVTGADFGKRFDLVDHEGKPRQLDDFRGKVVVLFFGFTHCPDVCPTTLAEFNAVFGQLGDAAQRVQVLFVTVDPERDTPEVLRSYVTAFNPAFLGLTGTPGQIADVAGEFRIIYKKVEGSRPGNYSVDHSAGTYIFDPQGRLRLYARYGQGAESLTSDIERLLNAG